MNSRPPEIPPHKLIRALRSYDLLPAIVFLPTRRKCDEAAAEVGGDRSQSADHERYERRRRIFEEFAEAHPEIRSHKHRKLLVNTGVASHHAGHLPAWKLVVEKMMSLGLLNAIFATSTVAAGVDFPARTVVIVNADTRGNRGWRPLTANELQQMTGRAGRRGRDNVGFAVLVPGQFQNPKRIAELLKAKPDPLESKFRATYTTLVNLLDAFKNFEQIREIVEKSFAFREAARRIEKSRAKASELRSQIAEMLDKRQIGLSAQDCIGFERLTAARRRLVERLPETANQIRFSWLESVVIPGRVVTQGRGAKRLFLVLQVNHGAVSAIRDDGQGTVIPILRINRVFSNIYRLSESQIEKAFLDVYENRNPPLDEPKPAQLPSDTAESEAVFDAAIEGFCSQAGTRRDEYLATLWEAAPLAAGIVELENEIERLRSRIWEPFERRARVLDHFHYIDLAAEIVTDRGKWLADVRVDRPLLVGEALSRGVFSGVGHTIVAGLMAAVAADSDRNYGDLRLSDELAEAMMALEETIYEVSNAEWRFGVEPNEEVNLSAATAAELWASGAGWNELVKRTGAEEGDLFRLISRTGEALLQIAQLRATHPIEAAVAAETAEVLLRAPVR
ncbi:MAG: hypothetical protein C4324_03575 [Blastocatellia bacterium]